MVQKKAHEVDRWLASPDSGIRMVLIYGPHRGLVAERAAGYAAAIVPRDDPFAVQKLDASDISGDAGRLIDELRSIPMFGGKRLVWLKDGSGAAKELAIVVDTFSQTIPEQAFLLVEAADLKKGSPLRAAFESSAAAIALPCYEDDARSLERVLDEALTAASLTMTLPARQAFKRLVGGDRLAIRAEVEKLILYAHGLAGIDVEDVLASAGDISSLSMEATADFVLSGKVADFDLSFARAVAAGTHPYAVLSAVMRQLQQLQALRYRMDREGIPPRNAVASARPPIFFARRENVAALLGSLDAATIARMLSRIQEAVQASRGGGTLAVSAAHRVLLSLCLEAARNLHRAA